MKPTRTSGDRKHRWLEYDGDWWQITIWRNLNPTTHAKVRARDLMGPLPDERYAEEFYEVVEQATPERIHAARARAVVWLAERRERRRAHDRQMEEYGLV